MKVQTSEKVIAVFMGNPCVSDAVPSTSMCEEEKHSHVKPEKRQNNQSEG